MKYSSDYVPPAPTAQITLRNTETLETIRSVPMLLDTGSDITLIPKVFCDLIGVRISSNESLELTGFDGSVSASYYVHLDFVFLNKLFRGKFLVFDDDEGIIGRDVLNKFKILLDGPNFEWDAIKESEPDNTH